MWYFNFKDYKEYCHLFRLKECNYTSLQSYKKFIKDLEEEIESYEIKSK